MYDKKKREIILIEVGITNQDLLQTTESEKMRKYDLLANEFGTLQGVPKVAAYKNKIFKFLKFSVNFKFSRIKAENTVYKAIGRPGEDHGQVIIVYN